MANNVTMEINVTLVIKNNLDNKCFKLFKNKFLYSEKLF